MTSATAVKVSRLLSEKRVTPRGAASVYDVRGDTGTHRVILGDDFSSCTCPAHGTCSHLTAARLLHDAIDEQHQLSHRAGRAA
jgi:uncharacterized Zn finger protein